MLNLVGYLKKINMAYQEKLANRIREAVAEITGIKEKEMFGGLSFMLNNKMCVGIIKDELMCRIDPALNDAVMEKKGCRPMAFTGKPMKGWIMVEESGMKSKKDFDYWLTLALDYNKKAKKAKKKTVAKKK
jgi:TfoX N-terminal domain.